jgi:hypothetical protein
MTMFSSPLHLFYTLATFVMVKSLQSATKLQNRVLEAGLNMSCLTISVTLTTDLYKNR